ncbi:hypothetical protein HDK77DRAFT_310371 [Phyllosticta capitalensis]
MPKDGHGTLALPSEATRRPRTGSASRMFVGRRRKLVPETTIGWKPWDLANSFCKGCLCRMIVLALLFIQSWFRWIDVAPNLRVPGEISISSRNTPDSGCAPRLHSSISLVKCMDLPCGHVDWHLETCFASNSMVPELQFFRLHWSLPAEWRIGRGNRFPSIGITASKEVSKEMSDVYRRASESGG